MASPRRVIALSQEQLSQMLSISRQTTNQILKDLEARQLVRVQRGEVEIIDLAGLPPHLRLRRATSAIKKRATVACSTAATAHFG